MIKNEEISAKNRFLNSFSSFLKKNKTPLLIILIVFVAAVVGFIIYNELQNNQNQKAAFLIEEAIDNYEEWLSLEEEEKLSEEKYESILEDLDGIITDFPRSFAAQNAYYIKANIHYELENWEEAADNYRYIASEYSHSYFAPLGLANAGVCYEELGEIEEAFSVYSQILEEYRTSFAGTPRILLSLGRLSEEREDYNGAAEYYNDLIDNFNASSWTKLARNRIIYFTTQNLIEE